MYNLEFSKGSYFKAISMTVAQKERRNNPLKPTFIKMWKSSGKFWMISIKGHPWETKPSVVQRLFWGKLAWLFHFKLLLFQKFCPLSHGKSLQVYPCSGSQRENRTFQTKQWVWLIFKAEWKFRDRRWASSSISDTFDQWNIKYVEQISWIKWKIKSAGRVTEGRKWLLKPCNN